MRSRSAVWRELHLSLERLYSDYARHGKDMAVPVLERALNPAVSRDTVEAEIAKRRLPIDLAADWPEFERLRAESFDGANLGTAEAPFELVYQGACFFRKVVMRYPPDDDFWTTRTKPMSSIGILALESLCRIHAGARAQKGGFAPSPQSCGETDDNLYSGYSGWVVFLRQRAAIDRHRDPRHKRRLVGQQEHGGFRDLLGARRAAHRVAGTAALIRASGSASLWPG